MKEARRERQSFCPDRESNYIPGARGLARYQLGYCFTPDLP